MGIWWAHLPFVAGMIYEWGIFSILGKSYLYSNIKKPRDFTRLAQELGIILV
jgi:hypothetical protein